MSRLALYCDRLMEATWLLILTTSPLYFDFLSSRIFEPDKATILRSLTIVLVLAWAIKAFEGERLRSGGRLPTSTTKELAPPNPLLWPVAFLVGVVLLATAFSLTPRISLLGSYQRLQGTITFLCYVVLFFAIAGNLRSREQIDRLLTVAILTSIPVALYGVAQRMSIDPLPWGSDVTQRVASTMGNPIFVAAYLIMVVPLTLAKLAEVIWRLARQPDAVQAAVDLRPALVTVAAVGGQILVTAYLLYAAAPSFSVWWAALPAMVLVLLLSLWVGNQRATPGLWLLQAMGLFLVLILQLITIYLAKSQGPWLGLAAGLVAFFTLGVFVIGRPSWKVAVAALLVVAVVLGALTFTRPVGPLQRVQQAVLTRLETGTGKVRVLIWQGVVELMRTRPEIGLEGDRWSSLRLLVGYGPEALYYAFPPVYPPDLAHYEARNATPDRSHDEILDRLSTTGVLGMIGYFVVLNVFFWFMLVRLGLVEPRDRRWATPLLLVLGPVGVLAYLVWMGFCGRRWRAPPLSWVTFLSVALFSAVVAHFVETQVGISIVSTLTYFWMALGLAVALPRLAAIGPTGELAGERTPVVEIAGGSGPVVGSQRASLSRREKRRRPSKAAQQAVSSAWV
ncbi:MAG: O-antigen ligase family protein, partial [Chloroflexi bacterium]|nr:O-antigen ligase family protein [Chloroflexota bacterium]